jgi:hypothetical protein
MVWEAPPKSGETRQLPDFTVDVEAPTTADASRDYDVHTTISSGGDGEGTFRGVFQVGIDGSWFNDGSYLPDIGLDTYTGGVVTETVPAGESVTLTNTENRFIIESSSFRVAPSDATWDINFKPTALTYGERVQNVGSYDITVESAETFERLEHTGFEGDGTSSGRTGYKFIAFRVRFTSEESIRVYELPYENFQVMAGEIAVSIAADDADGSPYFESAVYSRTIRFRTKTIRLRTTTRFPVGLSNKSLSSIPRTISRSDIRTCRAWLNPGPTGQL